MFNNEIGLVFQNEEHLARDEIFSRAEQYRLEKNWEQAFRLFKQLAEENHIAAMYNVGNAYAKGMGVKQDWSRAIEWYEKAAGAGDRLSMEEMAFCYFRGKGDLKPSNAMALDWYKRAADSGSGSAMFEIGRILTHNSELQKDFLTPQEWFEKAATAGHVDATFVAALYDFFMDCEPRISDEQRRNLLILAGQNGCDAVKLFFPNGLPEKIDTKILAQQIIQRYRPHEVAAVLEICKTQTDSLTEDFCLRLERILEFYRLIEHPVAADWDACWLLAKAKIHYHQSYADIQKSVLNTGPRYNALSPEGWILPRQARELTENKTGIVAISHVTIVNGEIFVLGPASDDPRIAKIFPEDVQTALILAFAENPDKPIRPVFSLEQALSVSSENPGLNRFDRKEFGPAWLAGTDFGRSLYWTDYIMKSIHSGNHFVSLYDGLKRKPYNPEEDDLTLPEVLTALEKQDFQSLKVPNLGSRLMLTLRAVEMNVLDSFAMIGKSKMLVEESFQRNILVNENDQTTSIEAYAQHFTECYDTISVAIPEFERLKQLLVLYRACEVLRENGCKLGDEQMVELRQVREKFIQQAKKQTDCKIQLVPKQIHRRSVICHGGIELGAAELCSMEISQSLRGRYCNG